jgi:membrane-associated phospholipid phosphatase
MRVAKRDAVFVVYFFIGMARNVLVVIWHCVIIKEPRFRKIHVIMIQMEKVNPLLSGFDNSSWNINK